MTAYLIVDIDVHDAARYEGYMAQVPALIARYRGEYVVRGGPFEVIEGDWVPKRIVIVAFPDVDAAKAFVNDPDYEPVKAIRHDSARSRVILVEGG